MVQTWSGYTASSLAHEHAFSLAQEQLDIQGALVQQLVQQATSQGSHTNGHLQDVFNSIAQTNHAPSQFHHQMLQHTQNDGQARSSEHDTYFMDEALDQDGPKKLAQMPVGMTLQGDLAQFQGSTGSQFGTPQPESIASLMRKMLLHGGIPHDIRLIADDGEIHAHRFMLIRRSPYFDCRLQGFARLDPWEAIPRQRVEGITVDVLRHVLVFLYTDMCDFHIETATLEDITTCIELLDASIRFGLKGLESLLLQHMLGPLALTLPDALQSRAQLRLMSQRTADEAYRDDARKLETSSSQWSAAGSNPVLAGDSVEASQAGDSCETSQALPTGIISQTFPIQSYPLMLDEVLNDGTQQGAPFDESQTSDQCAAEVSEKTEKLAMSIGESGATTLMIRNLPRNVKQRRFVKELDDSGFAGTYDYAYLPSSFGNGSEASGLGYAFVNFDNLEAVPRFVRSWHCTRRFKVPTAEIALTVTAAEHQGKEVNVRMWLRKGGRVRNPDLRPFVKETGGQVLGQDARDDYQSFVEQLIASMPNLRSMNTNPNANFADDIERSTGTTRSGVVAACNRDRDSFQ